LVTFLSISGVSNRLKTMGTRLAPTLAILFAALPALALQPVGVFVAAAGQHNPDALESIANLDSANGQADVGLGKVLPGVSARGAYTRNQFEAIVDFTQFGGGKVTVLPFNQWDAFATLTVPLIDLAGFERAAANKTSARAAGDRLVSTRLQVEGVVAQAYYQLVADLALLSASQKALEVSKESLRLAQNRHAAGTVPELDLDRARADVEQQNQQVSAAELQVALATRALESASGVTPEEGSVALDDDLRAEPALATEESAVEQLPSVVAAVRTTRASEQLLDGQRLALLPVLAGSVAEHGTTAPGFTGHNWIWQAMLNLTWSLDLTNFGNIRVQEGASGAARAQELRARLAARDAIHRQWETVSASISRSRSARVGLEAASHAARSARDRYQAGAITQLELLQAQRDAFAAEVSRIQADADLVNARAQLRLAMGTSLLATSGTVP
jgi:outer membrane protein TolC